MDIFLAALAVFSGWLIFRFNMIFERSKVLNSLESFLNTIRSWFSSSYPENLDDSGWFHPGKSVYKVDFSIVPNIINSNLISAELTGQLTYLIQLITRFNQRVDSFHTFLFSDIDLYRKSSEFYKMRLENKTYGDAYSELEKFKIEIESEKTCYHKKEESKKLLSYIKRYYNLQKVIHTDGIGTMTYYPDGIPNLNKCFNDVNCLLLQEKQKKRTYLNDEGIFMFGDIIFLLIPLGIIFF